VSQGILALDDRDRIDKHRHLNVLTSIPKGSLRFIMPDGSEVHRGHVGGIIKTVDHARRMPLQDGSILQVLTDRDVSANVSYDQIKLGSSFTVQVVLGELGPPHTQPIVPLTDQLQALLDYVRQDVIPLTPFF
jgi:hypothetical protein